MARSAITFVPCIGVFMVQIFSNFASKNDLFWCSLIFLHYDLLGFFGQGPLQKPFFVLFGLTEMKFDFVLCINFLIFWQSQTMLFFDLSQFSSTNFLTNTRFLSTMNVVSGNLVLFEGSYGTIFFLVPGYFDISKICHWFQFISIFKIELPPAFTGFVSSRRKRFNQEFSTRCDLVGYEFFEFQFESVVVLIVRNAQNVLIITIFFSIITHIPP